MTKSTELQKAGKLGKIQIASEVIEIIVSLATIDVKGVAGMSGGVVGGIAEKLGKKNLSKGVKVNVGKNETKVDVNIVIKYGASIAEVSSQIQENVKREIENMTGLQVTEVNVHVLGVDFKIDEEKLEQELK